MPDTGVMLQMIGVLGIAVGVPVVRVLRAIVEGLRATCDYFLFVEFPCEFDSFE